MQFSGFGLEGWSQAAKKKGWMVQIEAGSVLNGFASG